MYEREPPPNRNTGIPEHESNERDDLKRRIAAEHALTEFRTRDPSMWQWARAYDYVEASFGNEKTHVLRSLASFGTTRARQPAAHTSDESSFEVSFA